MPGAAAESADAAAPGADPFARMRTGPGRKPADPGAAPRSARARTPTFPPSGHAGGSWLSPVDPAPRVRGGCVAEPAAVDGSGPPSWAGVSVANTSSSRLEPRLGLPMPRSRRRRLRHSGSRRGRPHRRTRRGGRGGCGEGASRAETPVRVDGNASRLSLRGAGRDGPIRRPGTRERRRSDGRAGRARHPVRRDQPAVAPAPGARPPCSSKAAPGRSSQRYRSGRVLRRGLATAGATRGTGRIGMIRRGEGQHLGERLRTVLGRVRARDRRRGRHVPGSFGRAGHDRRGGTHVVTVPDWPDRPARESTAGT